MKVKITAINEDGELLDSVDVEIKDYTVARLAIIPLDGNEELSRSEGELVVGVLDKNGKPR